MRLWELEVGGRVLAAPVLPAMLRDAPRREGAGVSPSSDTTSAIVQATGSDGPALSEGEGRAAVRRAVEEAEGI